MIDAFMEKFRETFGAYPQSVGSWLLDIDSVRYMTEKYAIRYFGICREQLAVDAYTLWGGPYNQPYYPSVHNILCPAQNAENQVNAPVFRLLGIEPIRGYNEKRYARILNAMAVRPWSRSGNTAKTRTIWNGSLRPISTTKT